MRVCVPQARLGGARVHVAAGLALAAALPLLLGPGSSALGAMVLAAAYAMMALGLNVVVGSAGLLDLGYVAFYAIGAHVAGYFGSTFWAGALGGRRISVLVSGPAARMPGIHVSFLLVIMLAIVATTVVGVLIGVPTLRLRGGYVAVVTLAFGEIIGQVVSNGGGIGVLGGTLTGGPSGISALDPIDLPFLAPFAALDLRPWFWFALALVAVIVVIDVRLSDSRIGRAWRAMRDDEEAAASAGVPIVRTKLLAYGVGAAMGGVSGAFLASYLGTVSPGEFSFSFSIFILAMVVLGGLGSIGGAVLGAIALSALNSYLLPEVFRGLPAAVGLDFDLSQVSSGVYGLVLVVVVLLRPGGLA